MTSGYYCKDLEDKIVYYMQIWQYFECQWMNPLNAKSRFGWGCNSHKRSVWDTWSLSNYLWNFHKLCKYKCFCTLLELGTWFSRDRVFKIKIAIKHVYGHGCTLTYVCDHHHPFVLIHNYFQCTTVGFWESLATPVDVNDRGDTGYLDDGHLDDGHLDDGYLDDGHLSNLDGVLNSSGHLHSGQYDRPLRLAGLRCFHQKDS